MVMPLWQRLSTSTLTTSLYVKDTLREPSVQFFFKDGSLNEKRAALTIAVNKGLMLIAPL